MAADVEHLGGGQLSAQLGGDEVGLQAGLHRVLDPVFQIGDAAKLLLSGLGDHVTGAHAFFIMQNLKNRMTLLSLALIHRILIIS